MTKERTVHKPAKQGSISPAKAKAAVKKVTEDHDNTPKAPIKPKAKQSNKSNTKVASEVKVATNVAKPATEQYHQPTVEELKVQQDNLTKLLMLSNQKLNSALNENDKLREMYLKANNKSWWSITKERVAYTLKSWVFMV